MKKVIALVLALFSLVSVAQAEGTIDVTSFTTEELVVLKAELLSLKDSIDQELANRGEGVKNVLVPVGRYTVGEDIPAGTYTVTYEGAIISLVTVYSGKNDTYGTGYNLSANGSIGKLELSDGQIIEVLYGSVYFSQYSGLDF